MAIPGLVINLFKRAFFALWVQDLWPESLVVTKYVQNKYVLKAVELMVKLIYMGSDLVLVQSKAFYEPIERIYSKAKIEYFPNSFKKNGFQDNKATLPTHVEKILTENFCVVFAGNIGKAQSVETIVESAKKLKDLPNLKIVFVGSGSSLAWIQEEKARFNLDNIECVGRFDLTMMPLIYSKAKLMLLTLNSDDILKYTLPWKTQSYMAAGKPIVGGIDGEGARVITESKCGFAGKAEDAEALAANIRKAVNMNSHELEELGQNGLKYFEEHFEMQSQTKKLFQLIENS
ncbi:glycosyltransferase family 4 protein [bacterium]|nr:glycosyltransferase family 4 protein [bacterium]